MNILLINPNTTEAVTARLAEVARTAAPAGTAIIGATAPFGARYIASRASAAIAAHALLEVIAARIGRANPEGIGAVILGCFGDPGLAAAREVCPVPVVGLAGAAFEAATAMAGRFAIVTGGASWIPMLEELAAAQGLATRLAAVLALPQTGLQIMNDRARVEAQILDLVARCGRNHGAGAVILGGAGFAGWAAALGAASPVPLVDPVVAAVAAAIRAAAAGRPSTASDATETDGLSPALARLLSV